MIFSPNVPSVFLHVPLNSNVLEVLYQLFEQVICNQGNQLLKTYQFFWHLKINIYPHLLNKFMIIKLKLEIQQGPTRKQQTTSQWHLIYSINHFLKDQALTHDFCYLSKISQYHGRILTKLIYEIQLSTLVFQHQQAQKQSKFIINQMKQMIIIVCLQKYFEFRFDMNDQKRGSIIFILFIILKMSRVDINKLIDQITQNQKFVASIQKHVQAVHRTSEQKSQLPTFSFQKAGKYPWSIVQGNLPVEGQKMIEQITDMFGVIIDNNLHEILSRQFLNISNELLIIRDEMNQFTKEQEQKRLKMKEEFKQQIQTIKRRLIVQNSLNAPQKQFVRTRANGMLNSSVSSLASSEVKTQVKMQVDVLKKQVQSLRRQMSKSEITHTMNDKLVYLQDHFKHQMTDLKIKIESIKQKSQKNYHEVAAKINESNNKQHMSSQIKRAVKSYFKIYLQEINFCKSTITKIDEQTIPKLDKSLQQYVANQLKSLWVVVGNMKRRIESIEQQSNLHNESFMME